MGKALYKIRDSKIAAEKKTQENEICLYTLLIRDPHYFTTI